MNTLRDIMERRRAVRLFDPQKPLDTDCVRQCIELAQLAPTSSNMQLWEAYHVTSPTVLKQLGEACLGQSAATTAQQIVVFVTRQDKYRQHAEDVFHFEYHNVRRNYPVEKHAKYTRRYHLYYHRLMPFLYVRFFGLIGVFRKLLSFGIGLFRPIVRQVSESDVRVVLHKSCALAIENFMLAMTEVGYDTCPLEGFDSWKVKRALHLPLGTEVCMVIACGFRLPKGIRGDRFRQPLQEVYHLVD